MEIGLYFDYVCLFVYFDFDCGVDEFVDFDICGYLFVIVVDFG